MNFRLILLTQLFVISSHLCFSQELPSAGPDKHIYSGPEIDSLLKNPPCLEGWIPGQKGPLRRSDRPVDAPLDSTFTVQNLKISSDSVIINGWLYLPLGDGKFPLIILTNGGGDDSRPIKNYSEWIAPVLAHCGIAAFIHDKRGTGESTGIFKYTTFDDYARDAANCALFIAAHPKIDSSLIGVMGASEGGNIAIQAGIAYPQFKFVISYAGFVTNAVENRIYAQRGWLESMRLPDSIFKPAYDMHIRSIKAWASGDPKEHAKVDSAIVELRNKQDWRILPFTKREMDSIPDFSVVLPTWNSLSSDYPAGLAHFNKKWLAVFGALDKVVPSKESIKNISYYMSKSKNDNYRIAVLPETGHSPVNLKTKKMERVDNLILNWLNQEVLP